MQQALDFRAALLQSGGCQFQAAVTADYGEQIFEFTLDCAYTPENGAKMTVVTPESIAGITAVVTPGGASIEYDGASFALGKLAGGHLAPMALPELLGRCWCSEYILAAGTSQDGWRLTCVSGYDSDELRVDTWLDDAGQPEYCEISYDGQMLLRAELTAFQLGQATEELHENT